MEWRVRTLWIVVWLAAQPAAAINISINYDYDSSGFFSTSTSQGKKARAALEAAKDFYNSILTDTFNAVVPITYNSTLPGSTASTTWNWTEESWNPSNTSTRLPSKINPTLGANEYIVYAGAQSFSPGTLGEGAPGWFTMNETYSGTGLYTQIDINNMTFIRNTTFPNSVSLRGQISGFARWGGWVSFDKNTTTPWFLDYPSAVPTGSYDFYSVALHELGHAIGFGEQPDNNGPSAWKSNLSGSTFIGANAEALNNNNPVPLDTTVSTRPLAHWVQNQLSQVYATTTAQEVLMDPNAYAGARKKLTKLDAAALKDIGWTLATTPILYGDYNNNRVADAADYAVWRKNLNRSVTIPNDSTPGTVTTADYAVWRENFGISTVAGSESLLVLSATVPEPSTAVLTVLIGLVACFARRRPHLSGSTRCR